MSLKPEHENRLIVHELPSAPKFIGREAELDALRDFWASNDNIVSLIGLGGAGKTALADRFLAWVEANDAPDSVLVWSFYDDPDANAFLETLYRHLTGDKDAEVKGSGWFHLLREELSGSRRVLLILDGLERVQRESTDATGIYGELEDPLLRGLMVRLASTPGRTKAIITSRFPVSTVEPFLGKGYRVVNVEQLPLPAVQELLRHRQISADERELRQLVERFGSHALTLDLLAGAISSFYAGDLTVLPESGPLTNPSERLQYVLGLYEQNLPEIEKDVLARLCVFRFGVDASTLSRVFLTNQNPNLTGSLSNFSAESLDTLIAHLVDRHLVYREANDRYTVHPAIRDHFYRLFRDASDVHGAIAKHFSTLTDRPGIGLPSDKESLDLLEELIFHAIQAKSVNEAIEIYFSRLGGNEHLNGNLGEYSRTYRILSAFPECPDPSAMYHSERAFGNYSGALEWRPKNRYILLLTGDLEELSKDSSEPTRQMAFAMMGRDGVIPDRSPDFPICSAMVHLFRGDPDAARRIAEMEISISIYADDKIRNQLALAEVYRETGRLREAKELIEVASEWILQSASQEHLSTLHLARANLALAEGNLDSALFSINEGLLVACEAGFKIHECLFLTARALHAEAVLNLEQATDSARMALSIAQQCQFEHGVNIATQIAVRTHRVRA